MLSGRDVERGERASAEVLEQKELVSLAGQAEQGQKPEVSRCCYINPVVVITWYPRRTTDRKR